MKPMPRAAIDDNQRMSFRIRTADKAVLMRAAALAGSDLTEFVVRNAMQAAEDIVRNAERIPLSGRDSLKVLDLLENPPAANDRLRAAAQALPPLK
jgi:uncharacterized protein (DUF1778 family)